MPRTTLRLTAAGLGLALGTTVGLSPARAERVDLDDEPTISNNVVWEFDQSDVYILDGDGASVGEGTLGSRTDSLDGALAVAVNGVPLAARNGVATVTGRQLRVAPRSLAGLRVSSTYTALTGKNTLRLLVTLTNPTRRVQQRNVMVINGLGSDANTSIQATSTQDTSFERRDRWVVSLDAVGTDPVVTQIFGGTGDVAPRVGIRRPAPDDFGVITSARVPARSTRYLMFFATLTNEVSGALVSVDGFDGRRPPRFALAGLKAPVKRSILNWDL